MKRPTSTRVRGAGYSPLIESTPTTSNKHSNTSHQSSSQNSAPASYSSSVHDYQSQAEAKFECRIKIHAPKDDLNTLRPGVFSLAKTQKEPLIKRWGKLEKTQPSPCTVLSAACFEAEDKTLLHELFQDVAYNKNTLSRQNRAAVNIPMLNSFLLFPPSRPKVYWVGQRKAFTIIP